MASEVNADFDQVKIFANSVIAEMNAINQAIADLEEKPTREMFDIYFSIKGETPTGAYPLWTGETITNCKILYPDFWKELNWLAGNKTVPTVESNAAFDDMVEQYGECPCFYIDTLNDHVRLPKIVRFISSISQLSELGTAYNDQIKSHTHGLPGANSACAGGGLEGAAYGATGLDSMNELPENVAWGATFGAALPFGVHGVGRGARSAAKLFSPRLMTAGLSGGLGNAADNPEAVKLLKQGIRNNDDVAEVYFHRVHLQHNLSTCSISHSCHTPSRHIPYHYFYLLLNTHRKCFAMLYASLVIGYQS